MMIDTIVAISTPPGNGAMAIIRLSGDESFKIVSKIFFPKNKQTKLTKAKPNTIHYGDIIYKSKIIDDVLISIFKNPKSYTGEDSIEISCHGSEYIQQKILEILIKYGAILAKPGEFTQRAFLNGKLDLSQAEGVADLIASESEAEHKLAIQQVKGGFSAELSNLRNKMVHFVSYIELELDFAEEDVQFADRTQLAGLIEQVQTLLIKLIKSFQLGNVIKKGVNTAIVGKPNVGKSTLLNALLKEERAIVSAIEGTTRDAIEDTININGITFRFIDTAGLRSTTDEIEVKGIELTNKKITDAKIVLLLVDSSSNIEEIKTQYNEISNRITDLQHLLILLNKVDVKGHISKKEIEKIIYKDYKVISISAKYNDNINTLENELIRLVGFKKLNDSDIIVSNTRHYEALVKANEAVERALQCIVDEMPSDLMAMDIRQAIHYIGEITGEITTDEILGNIFKNFCIGK